MTRQLQSYHLAWLSVHADRDENWLRGRLGDGFHVHHVDGDHSNDDPANLVLLERSDHFMLHAGGRRMSFVTVSGPREATLFDGEAAYNLRKHGKKWVELARMIGVGQRRALSCAKVYAAHNGLDWPLGLYQPVVENGSVSKPKRDRAEYFRWRRAAAKETAS